MKNKKFIALVAGLCLVGSSTILASCGGDSTTTSSTQDSTSSSTSSSSSSSSSSSTSTGPVEGDHLTIAEAIALIPDNYDETTEKFYVTAKITKIKDASQGSFIIEDETGKMEVYYSFSEDGQFRYSELADRGVDVPVVGETVTFYGALKNFKGTFEIVDAWIQGLNYVAPDISEYTEMSIANARTAKEGAMVRIKGKVIALTKDSGSNPNGALIFDGTDSMYVYDADVAKQLNVNEDVDIAGQKSYFIADNEQSYAEKFGYTGSSQLVYAQVVTHEGTTEADFSNTKVNTVRDILNTSFDQDITGQLYKVNAYITKDEHTGAGGFTNYYIYDIDQKSSTYVYTQASGADFTWLDEYVSVQNEDGTVQGKVYTVYLTALNAKSTAQGCVWRFLPVKVVDENYKFELAEAPQFIYETQVLDQFEETYYADPNKEVITTYSSTLLGIQNATISYSSDNAAVAFNTVEGKTYMKVNAETSVPEVKITVTVSLAGQEAYTGTVTVAVTSLADVETINVREAIETAKGEQVRLRGIVGPSLVNQPGFYLIDDEGVIAIRLNNKDDISQFNIGDEVIIDGTRDEWGNSQYGGAEITTQICVSSATLFANLYGDNEYSTKSFISGKTIEYIKGLSYGEIIHTTEVYVVECYVAKTGSGQSAQYTLVDDLANVDDDNKSLDLYCSGVNQYSWLEQYVGQGKVTVEIAPCNWNNKTYLRGCILSVTDAKGVKTFNTLNFKN